MSEKEKDKTPETQPEKKKGRGHFWMIFGAALVLLIVYQSGRSAGSRSVVESNVSHPIPQGIEPVSEKIMTARERGAAARSVAQNNPATVPAGSVAQNMTPARVQEEESEDLELDKTEFEIEDEQEELEKERYFFDKDESPYKSKEDSGWLGSWLQSFGRRSREDDDDLGLDSESDFEREYGNRRGEFRGGY